jgi:hypothetical protein
MRVWAFVLLVAAVGCNAATVTATPSPSPAPGTLNQAKLKLRILEQFGQLAFCDPDYYPVARADEQALALQRLPEIQKDPATFSAILVQLGIATNPPYTEGQRLAIYREWKMLEALRLDQVGAAFHFDGVFTGFGSPFSASTNHIEGTVDQRGEITVTSSRPSGLPPCPICLARGTRIATPNGELAVEDLRVGDVVWTIDARGVPVAAPLIETGSVPVPVTHRLVHLRLSDGRSVDVSPRHPLADGRTVGDLRPADLYDGAAVVSAELAPYEGGATFDVLPAGPKGLYWANGVLLGSTLR